MTLHIAQERAVRGAPPGVRGWMYLGEDPAWPLEAARDELLGLERIPTAPALAAAAERLRQPYLDGIAELGVTNDSFAWWSSQLAAKNVYTFLFQRLCALAVAEELLDDDVLVVCSSVALGDEIAAAAAARGLRPQIRHGRSELDRRVRNAGFGLLDGLPRRRRVSPLIGPDPADTLLVTWVDERNFDADGAYRDPHLGPLAAMLREQGHEVSFLGRILPTAPFADIVRRLAACGERVHLPEAHLTAGDRRRSWRAAQSFDPAIPPDALVDGVPVARLARELITHQRIAHASAISYDPLMARLAAAGVRPQRIVFPWEGHAWETAMIASAHRHMPETEVIGYDNLNFSRFALSLYPGAAEVAIRPLPDRVVTNGETFARVLAAQGFPKERIRVGCALRHGDLTGKKPEVERREGARRCVLAAGSIDSAQTIEMVEAAHEAFGDDLLVKLHPASDVKRIRSSVTAPVRYVDEPLPEALRAARALLYTYSVVPYEALAACVPPIHFVSQTLLDLDQLDPTPDVSWTGGTPEQLRQALKDAEAEAAATDWPARADRVVQSALAPPTPSCMGAFLDPLTSVA